jgi:hypothetical protein
MIEFKLVLHSIRSTVTVVEIYEDGVYRAVLYPAEQGVRLISSHFLRVVNLSDTELEVWQFQFLPPTTTNVPHPPLRSDDEH